ncbi:MAG: NifU family protein [Bacteriovoracaceae bacterium]
MSLSIDIQPTPNPNALKFILETPVKNVGKSTYKKPTDAVNNPMAGALFTIRGIDQIHFFSNVITITKFGYEDWEEIENRVIQGITEKMPTHNADYEDPNPEEERRKLMTPEMIKIEAILDKRIRPGLQGDGGDLQVLKYDAADDVLLIKYQGACGTCPSSTTGTLEAIKGILRDEFNPDIEVYTVND